MSVCLLLRRVFVALGFGVDPACQPVGQVTNVASCRTSRLAQVAAQRLDAAVVAARSGVGIAVVDQILHQTITIASALCTVLDHIVDGLVVVLGVVFGSLVGLHQAWVVDTTVRCCGLDFRAAVGLILVSKGLVQGKI